MNRLVAILAVFILGSASVAGGQTALSYGFTVRDSTPDRVSVTTGHATVLANSVRMDMRGVSGFSRVGGSDLGDSISLISVGTGIAQTLSVLGHRNKSYVQFQPAVFLRAQREQMANGPGVSQLDFTGSSVTVDSIGPGDDISGYKTIHIRITALVKFAIPATPLGEQTVVADYFYAPALAEFSQTGEVLGGLASTVAFIPGVPQSLREKLEAADRRTHAGLPLKIVTTVNGALFGTGISHAETLEASDVQRVTAAPSLFAVPPDYKRVVPRGMPPSK